MFGGMKHSAIGAALLASCMLATGSVKAADLGGGCCADLEERVAELEATTARKGNRVVSLQIAGVVTQSLLIWDDGFESDAYLVENSYPSNYFNFRGEGRISASTKAGFYVEIGINGSTKSLTVDQTNDESTIPGPLASNALNIRHSMVFVEDEKFGRVSLGQTSMASDGITEINLSKGGVVRNSGHQLWTGSFFVRSDSDDDRFRHRDFFGGQLSQAIGEGDRFDLIKYDSPTIAGFRVSASWGENDMWDVALRYAGQWNSVRVAAGIGYAKWDEFSAQVFGGAGLNNGQINCVSSDVTGGGFEVDCSQLGMSAGAIHVPTGLYAHVAYGLKHDNNIGAGFDDETDSLYIQAGIEKNWFGYGPTTIFGEYQIVNSGRFINAAGNGYEGAEAEVWGIGFNQNFASASTDLYISYRQTSFSAEGVFGGGGEFEEGDVDFEDFGDIMAGMRITF